MVITASKMIPLGTQAPQFSLFDVVSQSIVTLDKISAQKKAMVIMFLCNHCPYVKHIQKGLIKLAHVYLEKEVGFVAINSNDPTHYPDDSPAHMREIALQWKYPFPYLYDETQEIAKAYQATCTPDFFVFNNSLQLVYRGQFDASSPGNGIPVTGNSLAYALDTILSHKKIPYKQHPSMGCNIKWKSF